MRIHHWPCAHCTLHSAQALRIHQRPLHRAMERHHPPYAGYTQNDMNHEKISDMDLRMCNCCPPRSIILVSILSHLDTTLL